MADWSAALRSPEAWVWVDDAALVAEVDVIAVDGPAAQPTNKLAVAAAASKRVFLFTSAPVK